MDNGPRANGAEPDNTANNRNAMVNKGDHLSL